MGRKRKKTGENEASEPNPFGVKKPPKKKKKKKRKKKKKVSNEEMAVDDVLLLAMNQGSQRGKRKRTVRGRGDEKSQPAADQKNTQSLEEAVNEAVAQMATVLHL